MLEWTRRARGAWGWPDSIETPLNEQAEAYLEEIKTLKPALPTRMVTSSVTLDEQGREIQLLLLGRGHTDGDVYISLPKDKVVVPKTDVERRTQSTQSLMPDALLQPLTPEQVNDLIAYLMSDAQVELPK